MCIYVHHTIRYNKIKQINNLNVEGKIRKRDFPYFVQLFMTVIVCVQRVYDRKARFKPPHFLSADCSFSKCPFQLGTTIWMCNLSLLSYNIKYTAVWFGHSIYIIYYIYSILTYIPNYSNPSGEHTCILSWIVCFIVFYKRKYRESKIENKI